MKKILVLLICTLVTLPSFAATSASELFATINKRLSYMEDVALYKADNQLPIEDVAREEVVIQKAKESAGEQGLDPASVESFFRVQIAVAKAIQYRYRADLLTQSASHQARDLNNEVRPALLTLGNQIIQEISQYLKANGHFSSDMRTDFLSLMDTGYVTEKEKELLFNALLEIRVKP